MRHFTVPRRLVLTSATLLVACALDVPATEADLQASGAPCRLADLFLHSPADGDGNAQPISVFKAPGQNDTYFAEMDYGMAGFDVEARAVPSDRCTLFEMVQTTTMVDPGSSVTVEIVVRDKSISDSARNSRLYKIKVSRFSGTETSLRALKIDHGILVPAFSMNQQNYTSYLDVTQDIIKVIFQRLDNGQVVGLASSLEEPLDSGRRLALPGDTLGPPIGEVQYLPSTLTSTIDVGRQRKIVVVVESADHSAVGRYTFIVTRPFCPEERRFFDGIAKACTDICNEGSFGNPSTGRCSICLQRHCAECDVQNVCSSCMDGFSLQGGQCILGSGNGGAGPMFKPVAVNQIKVNQAIFASRNMLGIIAATAATTAAICVCLFIAMCGGLGNRCNIGRSSRSRPYDSDEEYSMRSLRDPESFAYS